MEQDCREVHNVSDVFFFKVLMEGSKDRDKNAPKGEIR